MDRTTVRDALSLSGWFKSSRSQAESGCVEVNFSVPGYAGVRDSKLRDASPVLLLTSPGLPEFVRQIQAGLFEER